MLSISKPTRRAGQGEYYLSLAATDDYYLENEGEPPGCWLGEGASALGLFGLLEKAHFRNLLRGLSPDGKAKLVHNANSEGRRAGWDLTWSVPKSVSVAWSQAAPDTRKEIEECVRRAVKIGTDWRDESKSYDRLERSLNRWVGVTLYYPNAWRDRTEKSWVDEKFHVLDNVTLYDRDKPRHQTALPLSSFLWNDVIFRSFRAGNLKGIDFDLFKSLESAIAKRLYRFLDKRFFHRDHLEFHLKEMAWEHIGLARSYDTANLKRRLRPQPGNWQMRKRRSCSNISKWIIAIHSNPNSVRAQKWTFWSQRASCSKEEILPTGIATDPATGFAADLAAMFC